MHDKSCLATKERKLTFGSSNSQIYLCVKNFTLCEKLHIVHQISHILCSIKAVSLTYPMKNFTLGWFFYTTSGCDGCDKYELWLSAQLRSCWCRPSSRRLLSPSGGSPGLLTWIAHLDCPQVAHLDAQGMAGEANCLLLQGVFENQFLWLCHRTV